MAEWSIAPVLKTGVPQGTVSSNLTPSAMRYIGIDYGAKRIGVALSDASGKFAFPECSIQNNAAAAATLATLIAQKGIEAIVVGDARGSSGVENSVTKEAEHFAHTIAKRTGVSLHFGKELFSSIEASRYAPAHDEHNDAAAAAIILQRFLDASVK